MVNAICPNLSAYGLSIIGDGIASARAKNIIIRSLTQDIKHDFVQMLLVVKHLTAYGSEVCYTYFPETEKLMKQKLVTRVLTRAIYG